MKPGKPWWSIVGAIIWEGILFAEIAVELYTGERTVTELILTLAVCLVLAVIIHSFFMRRKHKNR